MKEVNGYINVGDTWYGGARNRNVYASTNGGSVVVDEGEGAVPPRDGPKKFVPHMNAPVWVRVRIQPCYGPQSV